jgi:hypothetical protein
MGYGRRLYALFGEVLERGIRRGEFKTGLSTEAVTHLLLWPFEGLPTNGASGIPTLTSRRKLRRISGYCLMGSVCKAYAWQVIGCVL